MADATIDREDNDMGGEMENGDKCRQDQDNGDLVKE